MIMDHRTSRSNRYALCLAALAGLLFLMTACGRTSVAGPTGTKAPTTQPTQAHTEAETTEVQQNVVDLVEELFALPEDVVAAAETSDAARMLQMINEQTYCMIGTVSADSVELSITVPDMKRIFTEQLDANAVITDPTAESERMMAAILERLQSADCPTVTNTVTAAIEQGDDGLQIVMSEELTDAMYGNLLTLFHGLYEQQMEG